MCGPQMTGGRRGGPIRDPRRTRTAPSCHRRQQETPLLATAPKPSPNLSFPIWERGLCPPPAPPLSAPPRLAVEAQGIRPRKHPEGAQGRHTFLAQMQGRAPPPRPHPRQVTGKGKGPRPLPYTGGAAAWDDLSARVGPAGAGNDLGSGSGQVGVAASEPTGPDTRPALPSALPAVLTTPDSDTTCSPHGGG